MDNKASLCHLALLRRMGTIFIALLSAVPSLAREPVVTVLADFEDESVATRIGEARNIAVSDCRLERTRLPARGQGSLSIDIGATQPNTSLACDLTFRAATRFDHVDQLTMYCWITEGRFGVSFLLEDAAGQRFETTSLSVDQHDRWIRIQTPLNADALKPLGGSRQPTFPIEVSGFRVMPHQIGSQTIHVDDIQVEHHVAPEDIIHGEFELDEPTHLYPPGAEVRAAVVLENRSRRQELNVDVELAWMRPDGTALTRERSTVVLPASGIDFRSHRRLDFSQRINKPGLYRLVARATVGIGGLPSVFETAIAVAPSNRRVSRGRSTFFAVRSNLLREPEIDQNLEIQLARELGVNLLVIDTPWRHIEPKQGQFDFDAIAPVIAAITDEDVDIAVMLRFTGSPEWLPNRQDTPATRLEKLVNAITRRFGRRVTRFQFAGSALESMSLAEQIRTVDDARESITESRDDIVLFPPAISLGADKTFGVAEYVKQNPDAPLMFLTRGDSAMALAQLEACRATAGLEWSKSHWWLHEAAPLDGPGHDVDAEEILRHYVTAGAAGVGGLIWYDLRDDDNDVSRSNAFLGLVRRDFSPKMRFLGYATAAGELTGYRCAGPVDGAPLEYDSALFIGGNRQVAVLMPKPNRRLPLVLTPIANVPGMIEVHDFERREWPLLLGQATPLITSTTRPLFIRLTTRQAQSAPQLQFAKPWLRAPATVFCGDDQAFTLEIDAFVPLQRSYLQVRLPGDIPIESTLSAISIQADRGDTISESITLTTSPSADWQETELTLRLSLEGQLAEVPMTVRQLAELKRARRGRSLSPEQHSLGTLAAEVGKRASAEGEVFGAYTRDELTLQVRIDDDRYVSTGSTEHGGDVLMIGVALEGGALRAIRIDPTTDNPKADPILSTSAEAIRGIDIRVESDAPDTRVFRMTIPAEVLGQASLSPRTHCLLAVRYRDDDADGFPAVPIEWGQGLDDGPSTIKYRWAQFSP